MKSAAGLISFVLMFISIIMLFVEYLFSKSFDGIIFNNINNILIGLATNFIGIIVTVSFVQYFLDKQSEKKQLEEETAMIIRYDRILAILIERYIMYFNCVTVPISQRNKITSFTLRAQFKFEDMCDLHEQSCHVCEGYFESSIVLFYKAEEKVREYLIKELENIQFRYHEYLRDVFREFVEQSIANDMKGAILGNANVTMGTEKMTDILKKCIKDSTYQWVEKAHNNTLGTNLMLPYVVLYDLLQTEIDLIVKYKEYMEQMCKIKRKII